GGTADQIFFPALPLVFGVAIPLAGLAGRRSNSCLSADSSRRSRGWAARPEPFPLEPLPLEALPVAPLPFDPFLLFAEPLRRLAAAEPFLPAAPLPLPFPAA